MRYMAAVLLLVAAMSAQNAPSTNKGRHLDIPAISREATGSIVSIVMSDKDGRPIAQGSGFLISKDGHIVTNYHVIKTGRSAVVKLPSGAFFAVDGVLASDESRDVAIIKAHGNNFRPLTLGDSDRLQVGEEVVAIGNPLSLESTVSNGIVSATRTIEDEGGKFVQITAPISPGSSGGPLFNMAGEVVGITTSHIVGGENLNFAIPINDVKPMLQGQIHAGEPPPRAGYFRPGEAARALPDEADEDMTASSSKTNVPITEPPKATYPAHIDITLDVSGSVASEYGRGITSTLNWSGPSDVTVSRSLTYDGKGDKLIIEVRADHNGLSWIPDKSNWAMYHLLLNGYRELYARGSCDNMGDCATSIRDAVRSYKSSKLAEVRPVPTKPPDELQVPREVKSQGTRDGSFHCDTDCVAQYEKGLREVDSILKANPNANPNAPEVAVLRNGFSIRHFRRQQLGTMVRLYTDDSNDSAFVDIPSAQIDHFETAKP